MSVNFGFGRVWMAARRLGITAFTALTVVLGVSGFDSSNAQAEDFDGEVVATTANFCRRGTTNAAGQLLRIGQYQALFSLYGTRYGGDGRTTFGLPDLRDSDANSPQRGWGQVRWCVTMHGIFPPRDTPEGFIRIANEIMATGANFCPYGGKKEIETTETLPHQGTITWCKATGGTDDEYRYITAQMHLISGDTCPKNTMAADGQILQIADNDALFSLLGITYGGDGRTDFALPKMASPAPGMIWCIVTRGIYPSYD